MKINHAALYVANLEASRHFFETYFGATSGTRYYNPNYGFTSYFLSFDNDTRLEIMNVPLSVCENTSSSHIGYDHIAFSVGDKTAVDALTKRLADDGYRIVGQPRTTGDGYYESCVLDAEGNKIEITE